MYQVTVVFKPKGTNLIQASETRRVEFGSSYETRDKLTKEAYELAEENGILTKYALDNHWEIGKIELVKN